MSEQRITAEMVRQANAARDGAIVRYPDGHLEARSTVPTLDGEVDTYEVVYGGDESLYEGHDLDGLSAAERDEAVAEALTALLDYRLAELDDL